MRKPSKKWPEVEPWSPENYGPAAAITNLRTTVRNEGRRAQRMAVESFRAGLNWEPVRNGLFWAGHAALTAAAVLMSGPVWFAISLAGPSNPFLWAPTLAAASLRLGFRFCTLFRHALVDGKLEPIEAVTVRLSYVWT